jgi:hypothetical protein
MNQRNLQQDAEPDVFDMERAPAGTPALNGAPAPANAAPAAPRTAGASGLVSKIGPVHFTVLAAIFAAVWILWPDGSARQATSAESNARLLSTQLQPGGPTDPGPPHAGQSQRMPQHAEEQRPPHAGPSTRAESAAATDAQDQTPPPVNTQIVEQQAQQAAALVAAIDTLNLRLAALETRQAAQSRVTQSPAAPSLRKSSHAPGPGTGQRPRASSRAKGGAPSAAPTLTTYALNTIFQGQAWVQHAERMYVVQEGDMIDELKIIRIDPMRRQVLTSRGIIH